MTELMKDFISVSTVLSLKKNLIVIHKVKVIYNLIRNNIETLNRKINIP